MVAQGCESADQLGVEVVKNSDEKGIGDSAPGEERFPALELVL